MMKALLLADAQVGLRDKVVKQCPLMLACQQYTEPPNKEYKFYLLTPLKTREKNAKAVHLGAILFKCDGKECTPERATNPGGSSKPGEEPSRALSTSSSVKW